MKNILLLSLMFLISLSTFAQKKPSVKGSKIVTIQKKEIGSFDVVEVQDGLEINLIKGDKNGIELEADDNLQDAISLTLTGSTVVIAATKQVSGFKKFNIRVTYTNTFKSVISKNKSIVNALETIILDDITFKSFDDSKLFLNLDVKNFQLVANDNSKAEINLKAENSAIQLNNNSELKSLIASNTFKCDLYQKAKADVEGDCIDMKLRLDNNSKIIANKMTAKNIKLIAEAYTSCSVFAEMLVELEATGNAEIDLFGTAKVDLKKFEDVAILRKRILKQ